ncbi:hypothetical protein I582_00001, partial [Enterococcus casseliflavus ATCC 49996]
MLKEFFNKFNAYFLEQPSIARRSTQNRPKGQ